MIMKLPFSSCLLPGSSSLHYASSSLLFLHPRLDEISNKPYELGIYPLNFDANLETMVKVYETCKTTKNNLETKSVVLKDLHMSIGLKNMISTQKALKTYLNRTQNSTFWVLIIWARNEQRRLVRIIPPRNFEESIVRHLFQENPTPQMDHPRSQ